MNPKNVNDYEPIDFWYAYIGWDTSNRVKWDVARFTMRAHLSEKDMGKLIFAWEKGQKGDLKKLKEWAENNKDAAIFK